MAGPRRGFRGQLAMLHSGAPGRAGQAGALPGTVAVIVWQEEHEGRAGSPRSSAGTVGAQMFEEYAKLATVYLARATELCAALLIGLAALRATVKGLWLYFRRRTPDLNDETIRL